MMKRIKRKILTIQAGAIVALMAGIQDAKANNFGDIAENIADSIAVLPGLLTSIAYLFGLLLGVLGVLKVKDHVENPGQTPLKDGAIRMASGGALFALPIVYEAMYNTIGDTSNFVESARVNRVEFNVN